MQSTSFVEEVEEILHRDLSKLATARDVPRLCKRICVRFATAEMPPAHDTLSLCRTLVQVLEDKVEVVDMPEAGDIVRRLMQGATTEQLRFVLHALNQNIIAPAAVRLKFGLGALGLATKDSGEWNINVDVSLDRKRIQVVHTRGELFLNDSKPAFRWRLAVTNVAGMHALTILQADESLRHVLQGVVSATTCPPTGSLPPLEDYLKDGYFTW
jgi:hypothetical protein